MRKRILAILLAVVFGVSLFTITASASGGDITWDTPGGLTLTSADNGKTITVTPNASGTLGMLGGVASVTLWQHIHHQSHVSGRSAHSTQHTAHRLLYPT